MIKNYTLQPHEDEEKLEDILKSIRGLIDEKRNDILQHDSNKYTESFQKEDQILELINIVEIDNNSNSIMHNDKLISKETHQKTAEYIRDFSEKLSNNNYCQEKLMEDMLYSFIKPILREWLDNNLPRIVEKVVADEIRCLIPKNN